MKYVKPPRPEIIFGVFDQHRMLVQPQPVRPDRNHYVGYKCEPFYGIGGSAITATREEAETRLVNSLERWQRRVREAQRNALTLAQVFEGREFSRVTIDSFYGTLNFIPRQGETITLQRTRWAAYSGPAITGAYETPFTVTKVYATGRKMKIEDGSYLEFPRKMDLIHHQINASILDQIYGTD